MVSCQEGTYRRHVCFEDDDGEVKRRSERAAWCLCGCQSLQEGAEGGSVLD